MRNSIASTIWRFSTTRMLHEYVERLYLPAAAAGDAARARISPRRRVDALRGGHRWRPGSRWRWPSTTTSRSGTSAGCSTRSTGRPTCRCSRRSSATPASASRSTTPARCSSGWQPSGRRSSSGCARSSSKDQVEVLGGGLYEPVLASLPEHDRVDQLTRMAGVIEGIAGRRPTGAWLAERVWEPDLPTALAAAGYRWTILDDQHFRAASIPEENLWGAYTTEDQGHLLTVFGTEQGLRYRIPFGSVEDVIGYLRDHATEAGDRVGMMGDDGEKFGAWPSTYAHCWGDGRWVDRFFDALEASRDWLTTVTPSAVARARAADRARLRAHVLVRRDGRVGAAGRRDGRVHAPPPPGRRGAPSRGALAARRVLAQLPGQVPRDQRPPQADAADVARRSPRCPRARARAPRSTTSTAASRTTATGTACSAASTSRTCASRRTST